MNEHIAFVIKTVRSVNRVTQAELAEVISKTPGHVGSLERGIATPSYKVMEKIIRKYDIDANLFFGRTRQDTASLIESTTKYFKNLLIEVNEKVATYEKDVEKITTEDLDKGKNNDIID